MKVKHILLLFLVGIILMIISGLFKILHLPGASWLLISSTSVKVVAVILTIWKLFTTKKFREFLDA